eukprot:m.50942 g.50942  ORF g.50942 m.50942 type:complete len:247 (-) comp12186_c0_seq1:88-828(-)
MRLVVEDDFSAPTLNRSLWNVLEQVHRGGVYTADNVRVDNGVLVLETRAQNLSVDGTPYYVTSGAVNTSGHFHQRGGRFSARVRLPNVNESPGYTLHSSIWLFSNQRDRNNSGCPQEIDVVEQYAGCSPPCITSKAAGNLHTFAGGRGTSSPQCTRFASAGQYWRLDDFTSQWREFVVDWIPNTRLVMRIDNVTVSDYTNTTLLAHMTDPLFYALTSCVMERVPPVVTDKLPQQYLIDWVKIWAWE